MRVTPTQIAVVVPSYNRKEFLLQALASVFEQTEQPGEVIVVDDGSTDDSARAVAEAFPQVTYLQQENRGVSAARNLGVQQTGKAWIAFLDSDDLWLPEKLSKQVEALNSESGDAFVCHTEEAWVRAGKPVPVPPKYKKEGGWIFENSLRHCAISPSTALLHRSVFDVIGLFDESMRVCEDYDLWLRVTQRYRVVLEATPLIEKRAGHADQLSFSTWGLDRFRAQSLHRFLQTTELDVKQRVAGEKALLAMCSVIVKGAEKRGNDLVKTEFSEMMSQYSLE